MRYTRSIAVAAYFVVMLVWVFWIVDRQVFFGEPLGDNLAAATVAIVQVFTGFAVGRWWALLLPLPLVLVGVPLGYPSTNLGEPLPIWVALLMGAPIATALLAVGVALRRLGLWQGDLGVRERGAEPR